MITTPEQRHDIYKHAMKGFSSFLVKLGTVLGLVIGYVQLGWPLPASQAQVTHTNERIDDLSLLVLYAQKTQILVDIEDNETAMMDVPAQSRKPYMAIARHLSQKLNAVDKSIEDLER